MTLFFSFHRVQKKHKGVPLQTFFCFFPLNEPCQLNRFPLIEECVSQTTPKGEKITYHNILDLEQLRMKWPIDSPSHLHKKHNKIHHLLLSWSSVLPHVVSHAKKPTLLEPKYSTLAM